MPTNMTPAIPPTNRNKEQGCYNKKVNTDLCVDVKTFLRRDRVTQLGKGYTGVLTRDTEDHYTFVEMLPTTTGKRNPHVFTGKYITITRRDDGTLRPNFRPMKRDEHFSIESYAIGVMRELRDALIGLVEEGDSK